MIKKNLNRINSELPSDVLLVAVSKTKTPQMIQEAYEEGHKVFGENKVQEMTEKHAVLPKDIHWHLIGHLQSNKVKYIAPFVSLIHSVDSLKLLKEINKQGIKYERTIDCLLQFYIAEEETKYGMSMDDATEILESDEFTVYENISITGVMGMATFTKNEEQIREEFRTLENYFNVLKSHYFKFNNSFKHISMGMSDDYKIAIEEGSTIVRIGSLIFGSR
jgi:pyridoxal phosphate enzyme (YggS family)